MSARVLGIDPGSRWVGYALHGCAGYLSAGVLDLEALGAAGVVLRLRTLAAGAGVERAGVEVVEAVGWRPGFGPRMAGDLVRCGRLAGRLVQALTDDGLLVSEVTAEEVRLHFFNATSVDAKATRALCERWAWPRKLPGVLAAVAGHARDGGLVAAYVARSTP